MVIWETFAKNFAVLKWTYCAMIFWKCWRYQRKTGFSKDSRKADVLSLHIPWTPETNKMVDAAFINAFAKPF
jgi:lactate dehydrogenase-like 2-hydroxyacid dehydrogenase